MLPPQNSFHRYSWNHPWVWALPGVMLVFLTTIVLLDGNTALFYVLNQISRYTGSTVWMPITLLGDATLMLTLLLLFVGRRSQLVWAVVCAAIIATLLVHGLKGLLAIPRPAAVLSLDSLQIIGPLIEKKAFPSGHTATIFTFAGVFCLARFPAWQKLAVVVIAGVAGLSRVVVGAHWPLDVCGGAIIGWSAAVCGVLLSQHWQWGSLYVGQRVLAILLLVPAFWLLFGHNTGFAQLRWLQYGIALCSLAYAGPAILRLFKEKQP